MSEMESSPIVILSEDDDDDDDIVVLKEEKAPIASDDSIDDDEVIFIAQSTPTTSLTSKGRNSSILGSCKTEPAATKDLTRSLSITTAFDLSLTLTGPLDLSKHPHRDGDLIGVQNASPMAGSKVTDAETNLTNMEEADSQDITDDILDSVSSSLDSSFVGPGSPSARSDISDNSQSSCPHTSSSSWPVKWGTPVPALAASPNSSILGSVSSSSSSSTLEDDDDLWELLKPVTDIQACAAKDANLVAPVNSSVPANIQYNICDTTKSSSTSSLSASSTNQAAACNSNSAPATPTSKSLLHRFFSSQNTVSGTPSGVLSDLNITVTSSLFPSAADADGSTVAKVKLSPKPLCATDARVKPLLSVPKVEPLCMPSTSYSGSSQAAVLCSSRTNAELLSSYGTNPSVFPSSCLEPVQVVSRSSYTNVSGSSVVFISGSGGVPVSSSGICSSVSTSRMGSGSVFSFGIDSGLMTISSSSSSSSSSPTVGTSSSLTSASGIGFGSGSTSPPGSGCRSTSVSATHSGVTRISSTNKLSQNSLPLRKRVHPDPKDLVSPPPVSCKSEDSCVNCKCVLLGLKVSRCSQAHPVCGMCLEDQVKLILTDKQGSLKCILTTCDSYYPMSELKHTLPAMVVEILEDKLHKDYINFVADMIMPDSGDTSNQPGTSSNASKATSTTQSKGDDSDSPKKPKIDDILDQFEPLKDLAGKPAKSAAEEIPPTWDTIDKMFPQNQVIVMLEPESEEYVGIAVKFHHTLTFPSADIVKISRIQNPILWKYYQLKRTEMIRDNDGHAVEERQLFHGTSGTVVEAICRKGFDWRVCGKHGCMYGQGSYFAKAASYSHQYTDRPSAGALFQPGTVRPSSGLMHLNLNLSRLANCLKVIHQHFPPPPAHANSYGSLPGLPPSQLKPQSQSSTLHNNNLPAAKILTGNNHTTVLPSRSGISSSSQLQSQPQQQGMIPPWAGPLLPSSTSSSGNWNYPSVTMGSNLSAFAIANKNATWYSQFPPQQVAGATEASSSAAASSLTASSPSAVPPVQKVALDARSRVISVMDIASSTNRKMFLAKVLVGKYTGGTNSHRKPPPFFPHEPYGKCYDSCVDNIWDPKIFVIFDSNQAYPEYIVEYNVVSD